MVIFMENYTDKLPYQKVKENYCEVCKTVSELSDGRCKVLLATKTVSVEQINRLALDNGCLLIGENKVQELCDKYPQLDKERLEIHFIGHLQTNKVKQIADKVTMIHSVDSLKLALEIDRRSREAGKRMDVLCEINIGREADKGGVLPEEAEKLCFVISKLENLRLRGIMTMAPKLENENDYVPYFEETQRLYERIRVSNPEFTDFDTLSMGMSESYKTAAKCGSTMVRVGSAVFGKRIYPTEA